MKKILIMAIVLMTVPFVSFAQIGAATSVPATGTITITNPGLLPGEFFYFLDRWSEVLNIAVTFNKENKARKHLKYAKERIAEMRDVLKDSAAKLDDIADAKADFDERVQEAALLVKEEKDKGADVADLARELDDELDDAKDELKDILNEHQDEMSQAEAGIRAKLAALSADDRCRRSSLGERSSSPLSRSHRTHPHPRQHVQMKTPAHWNLKFVVWNLFGIWILNFGICL